MVFKPFYLQLVLPFNNENMWRYKDYSKWYVEDYQKTIEMSFFKKHGYLNGDNINITGGMKWMRNQEETGNIWFEVISKSMYPSQELRKSSDKSEVATSSDKWQGLLTSDNLWQHKTLRVYFMQTNRETWEKKRFDYKIQLTSTPCNYWGYRYWFVCPCGWNRSNKLYLQGNWIFASRKTLWLKYEDQNQSKKRREMNMVFWKEYEARELYKTIKYKWRNGKPTRKYKSYMKKMRVWIPAKEKESLDSC